MRDRNPRLSSTKRSAKRAGRIALDDDQPRTSDYGRNAPRNQAYVPVRVGEAAAAKLHDREPGQAEIRRPKRMLAGQDDERSGAPVREGLCKRSELDRLGTGPDDERHLIVVQSPP